MVIINRFTGVPHYGKFALAKIRDQNRILDVIDGTDPEYFEVDDIIAPIIEKLIQRDIITYWSCSGHIGAHSPYLVIGDYFTQVNEIVRECLNSDDDFNKEFVDRVSHISFMTVQQSKKVIDKYQSSVKNSGLKVIADVVGSDGKVEAYSLLATGIYFKTYYQFCDEHGIDRYDELDCIEYYVQLWKWIDSLIDRFVEDKY